LNNQNHVAEHLSSVRCKGIGCSCATTVPAKTNRLLISHGSKVQCLLIGFSFMIISHWVVMAESFVLLKFSIS